ncbi:SDR family oxidoreductase [Streptomyces lienomycini]|uniref:SDR family oxidoreductase n=2 Tax=Streptomyces TaxID=1883 RepID=A0ABV9WTM8_9ACTN|nr:SDR family oxidoreductase [Streptomyces lienomycini]
MTITQTEALAARKATAAGRRALQAQGVYLGTTGADLRTAFLFPGHGAQYPDMFADLAAENPVAARTFERIDEIYRSLAGHTLTSRMFGFGGNDPAKELQDPVVMQPAIFAGSMVVHRVLESQGITADTYIGHSLGEISALVAAGALSLEDGVRAVYGRGLAVKVVPEDRRGGMLSLHTDSDRSREQLARLLLLLRGGQNGYLVRSLVNSPDQTVLSGDSAAIDRAAELCRERGIKATRLRVSHGFHSDLLTDAVPHLERTLAALDWRAPRAPVLSTVIGDYYTEQDVPDLPLLLARQLVTPFSFQDLVGRLHADGLNSFVEVGPKSILSGLTERILADADGDVLVTPTNIQSLGGVESMRRFTAFAEVHELTGRGGPQPDAAPREPAGDGAPDPVHLREELLQVVARTTGYPVRLLDPAQLMGASLGLSPRVREELAAALAAHLGLADTVVPTESDAPLGHLLDRLVDASRGVSAPAATARETAAAPDTPAQATPAAAPVPDAPVASAAGAPEAPESVEPAGPAVVTAEVLAEAERVVWEVAEAKTGYPADLLEADLDLEADLGIDSVRQAEILGEVREVLDLPVVEDVDTASLNTLHRIAEFVAGLRAATLPAPVASAAGAPEAPESPASVEPVGPVGPAVVTAEVLAEAERVVWEVAEAKTGYPADLLEADLDLEADLGIDSVRQAEILGEVREVLDLPVVEDVDTASLNTLHRIAEFVAGLQAATGRSPRGGGASDPGGGDGGSDDSHIPGAAPARPVLPPVLERTVDRIAGRYVPLAVESPLDHPGARPFPLDGKAVVVITGRDTALAREVLPRLAERGAHPCVVAPEGAPLPDDWPTARADFTDHDSLARALDSAREGREVQVVVNLHPYGGGPDPVAATTSFDRPADEWSAVSDEHFTVNLLAAKAYFADLTRAGADGAWFAATAVGGVFGLEADGAMDPLGGLTAGFAKSLDLELPDTRVKVVDFTEGDAPTAAGLLLAELGTDAEPTVEVGHLRGLRKIVQVLPHEIGTHERQRPLSLEPGSVVVFSGGSRGITYACARELAHLDGVRVVVLGRTRPAEGTEDWMALDDEGFAALGRSWFPQAKKKNPAITPVEAKKQFGALANARELYRNIQELHAVNPLCVYEVCDVSDGDQVAATIGALRERYGRIDGVVHAAGLDSVAAVPKKALDHARHVVRVKADGAHHLWHAVKHDDLKFFGFFGSFLGRFGMDGQVDYTAGADLVSKLSALLSRRNPGLRVFTLCWTGWADVGMAATEAVRRVQEQGRGLRYLSVEEGVQHFAREVFQGGDDPEVLVFGEIGKNSYGGQDASMDAARTGVGVPVGPDGSVRDRIALPLLDTVSEVTGVRVRAAKRLDPRADRYLDDHRVKGAGTYPGVLHIEGHVQAAGLLVPEHTVVAAENVEFLKFVKHLPNFPTRLAFEAEAEAEAEAAAAAPSGAEAERDEGTRRIRAEIRSDLVTADGRVLETGRLHSRGTYLFARRPADPPPPDPGLAALVEESAKLDIDRFYARAARQITFGPRFRQVRRIGFVGDVEAGRTVSEIVVDAGRGLFSSVSTPRLRTLPLVIDNAWRSTLLWAYHHLGSHVVPVSIAAMRFYRVPLPGETVHSDSTVAADPGGKPGDLRVGTVIRDAAGHALCEIRDLVVTQVGRDEGDTRLLD